MQKHCQECHRLEFEPAVTSRQVPHGRPEEARTVVREFYANLAEDMPEPELMRLSSTFLDLIAKDKQARKKRDEQYEEGLRRTGLGDDAPVRGEPDVVTHVRRQVALRDAPVGGREEQEQRAFVGGGDHPEG